ncbi:MAG TPA: hypothetical protein VK866_01140 [Acidimicrobiales bacterium]|nr:hypothetical protein [Acidimicrobiales bacterium]
MEPPSADPDGPTPDGAGPDRGPGVWAVALALAVGAILGAALALVGRDDGARLAAPPASDSVVESDAAAASFLAAWERSRTATYLVESTFVRTTPTGASVAAASTVVQRPPDRLVAQGGSVSGWLDGRRRVCDTTPEGVRCQELDVEGSWAAEVAAELEILTGYVSGAAPLYRVATDDAGCHRLRLARAVLAPPYGRRALWCFDAATGAVSRLEIERREATDVVVADRIVAAVTDADLAAVAEPPPPG